MKDIFKIITTTHEKAGTGIAIGITVKIGEREILCPISGVCDSMEAFESEISAINKNFENMLSNVRTIFEGSGAEGLPELKSDIEPEKAWEILSSLNEEDRFIALFNSLDPGKRRVIADYILTKCNIFSGKGAVFSSRYDN